jgi:hypothetical protein
MAPGLNSGCFAAGTLSLLVSEELPYDADSSGSAKPSEYRLQLGPHWFGDFI